MTTLDEVLLFLRDFLYKLDFWGLLLRLDRTNNKNVETLKALDYTYGHIKEILKQLEPVDYSEGPLPDNLYRNSDMWVFGKRVKGREIYIKIQMGRPEMETICISFHFAAHPMHYPFKKSSI